MAPLEALGGAHGDPWDTPEAPRGPLGTHGAPLEAQGGPWGALGPPNEPMGGPWAPRIFLLDPQWRADPKFRIPIEKSDFEIIWVLIWFRLVLTRVSESA